MPKDRAGVWAVGGGVCARARARVTAPHATHTTPRHRGTGAQRLTPCHTRAHVHTHSLALHISHSAAFRHVTQQISLTPHTRTRHKAVADQSLKSSIAHVASVDSRNHPQLPTRGLFAKVKNELAGLVSVCVLSGRVRVRVRVRARGRVWV